MLFRSGLDPLPWAGDVQTRVAANMGNAIFVAAYLIMVTPLTAGRIVESFNDILHRQESRITDILRASGYIFLIAVQLLTTWYSQSRGPWLGILAAAFFFPYLMLILLQRQALKEESAPYVWHQDVLRGIGLGLGSLALAVILVGLGVWALSGSTGLYVGGGLAGLVFGGIWLYMIVQRKGWRWLWIGWFTIVLVIFGVGLAMNLPGPLQQRVQQVPSLSRMTTILEWDTGTGRVRTLIWEGALDLISVHEPLDYPDGTQDAFNALRPLIGYGPESMYVAYNRFYPPLLGHYESRTASPDRSHNETLDSVVITGVLGLAAYLFVFGSVFYWGLRWLGLLEGRRQLWLYLGLAVAIFAGLFAFFISQGHLYFFAVAIPLGFIGGWGIFLTWGALRATLRGQSADGEGGEGIGAHPHAILIVSILAAVLAHFVEINFGIAIAATRTTFWTLAGLLVVLGLQWVPGEESIVDASQVEVVEPLPESALSRRKRRQRLEKAPLQRVRPNTGWVGAVLALSLIAAFLLSTIAFDFINNPDRLTDGGDVFWRSLTILSTQQRTSYGALMVLVFSGILLGVVGLSEFDREGLFGARRGQSLALSSLLYAGVTLIVFLFFSGVLSGLHARLPQIQPKTVEEVIVVAEQLTGLLGYYYALMFFTLCAVGLALFLGSEAPKKWLEWLSLIVLPFALLVGILLIRAYNYDLIRADIIFKQGNVYANNADAGQKQIGIMHYEKAIEYVPLEDQYYLFLGKGYLELVQSLPADVDATQREALFLTTEEVLQKAREVNRLNTDHSANLGRFYRSWAAQVSDADQRATLMAKAVESYRDAVTLSPNNSILWNELAILYAFDLQDQLSFQKTISQSLALDTEFDTTWMIIGDVEANINQDSAAAIEAYRKALKLAPGNCTVQHVVGSLQIQQSQWAGAITDLEGALEYCAASSNAWDMYRMLAVAYFYQGEQSEALEMANQALLLVPEDQRSVIEQLIAAIQQQAPTELVPGASPVPTPEPAPDSSVPVTP